MGTHLALVDNETKIKVERERRHEIHGAGGRGEEGRRQVASAHHWNVLVPLPRVAHNGAVI